MGREPSNQPTPHFPIASAPRGTFAHFPEEGRDGKAINASAGIPHANHLGTLSPPSVGSPTPAGVATPWGLDCWHCKSVQGPFCVSVSFSCLSQLRAEHQSEGGPSLWFRESGDQVSQPLPGVRGWGWGGEPDSSLVRSKSWGGVGQSSRLVLRTRHVVAAYCFPGTHSLLPQPEGESNHFLLLSQDPGRTWWWWEGDREGSPLVPMLCPSVTLDPMGISNS